MIHLSDRRILGLPLGLGLLWWVHLLNDFYAGILPIVLLYHRELLGLSLAQVGIVAGTYSFTLALAQPLFGHLADRFGQRQFALGGVIWAMIMAGTWGFASSFSVLFLLAALAALGSAAFHPTGFAGTRQIAAAKKGLYISIFLTGGSLGYAVGPLIAGNVFDSFGLRGTSLIAVGTLVLVVGPAMMMPLAQAQTTTDRQTTQPDLHTQTLWLATLVVLFVGGLRTWVHWSLTTYIPQYLVALGFAAPEASRWLSVFLIAFSAGILAGGPLADKFGGRPVIIGSFAMLALAVIFIARPIAGLPMGFLVGAAGLCIGFPLSMIIVLGQSLIPRGTGLASGLVIGSSFAIGAAGVTLTGIIADRWGLTTGLMSLAGLALIAMLTAFALPVNRQTT